MKYRILFITVAASLCFSCEISVSNIYLQDVTVDSNGLSCKGIKVMDHTEKNDRTEFSYGEKIVFLYDEMKGFALQDGKAYPNMSIYLITKQGDTILSKPNLFPHEQGYTEKDLNLRTNVLFAKPMLPNNEYKVAVNVVDKNSDAYYNWERNFSVIHNPLLKTKKNGFTYEVQYLYSNNREVVIANNIIKRNEEIALFIENIEGFEVDSYGDANIKATIDLTEADGTLINLNDDLFPNLVNAKDLNEQLYASLKITKKNIKNPVTCTFTLKDTNNGHQLETTFDLTVID